jgi:hypothetical protein
MYITASIILVCLSVCLQGHERHAAKIYRVLFGYLKKKLIFGVEQEHTECSMQQILSLNLLHEMTCRSTQHMKKTEKINKSRHIYKTFPKH